MNLIDPAEIKRLNWDQLRSRVSGLRERVYLWLLDKQPEYFTTQAIADALEINLLTVRPRVTELVQLGFVRCVGRNWQKEGLYEAVPVASVQSSHESRREKEHQPELF